MALLGWVPGAEEAQAETSGRLPDLAQPRFVHNTSGRFESRWATVTVLPGSPAILLKVGHRMTTRSMMGTRMILKDVSFTLSRKHASFTT